MTEVDFGVGPVAGSLDVSWIHGAPSRRRSTDPAIQVHAFDPHTYVLRQSKRVHYEAPFMYLLFGNERALLVDTGATADASAFPLRATVDGLIERWLEDRPRASYSLVVAHTHAHGDHVAGDGQFAGRADTAVVGHDRADVEAFFGFVSWPEDTVPFDLGGRELVVTAIPGHHGASIAVYDPWSGFLLTGDTVYPGRLYVEDMPSFIASLERLIEIAETRDVRHVMGCHIEMTSTPGVDYPLGSAFQPDEPPLQMSVEQLRAVHRAAVEARTRPGPHWHDDFAVFNGPCRREMLRQAARALLARARALALTFTGL
jgi:glyoxylase-like metal-dependent hydrolase (beta-lactamase superfamily II)